MIVGYLRLPARGTLLEQWLAHDLADAIAKVGHTSGTAKTEAKNHVAESFHRLNERLRGASDTTLARYEDRDVTRVTERRSLLEVLNELECLPAVDEFPNVDDTLLPLDGDPLAPEK